MKCWRIELGLVLLFVAACAGPSHPASDRSDAVGAMDVPDPTVVSVTLAADTADLVGAAATLALETPTAANTDVASPSPVPLPTATRTREPIVPTRVATLTAAPVPEASGLELPELTPEGRERFGVGGAGPNIALLPVERLGIGWYLTWGSAVDPPGPGGIEFWQMVRVSEQGFRPDAAAIEAAARANPGSVWLIGNEPDVRWQDNTTPERYAELYHELYSLLKTTDPECRVAIAGVTQPTPLRLEYLDRVLSAYATRFSATLPLDIWNVHNFILREERDSWGVDIPPGLDAITGTLYAVEDHDDMGIFCDQIVTFRRWMAARGYRNSPLAVTEYGILMPEDYGFDATRVQTFLYATFDYFLTAQDAELGYPADANRLVQWWCWYSLLDRELYPTGNLFDPGTGAPTSLGVAWAAYTPPVDVLR